MNLWAMDNQELATLMRRTAKHAEDAAGRQTPEAQKAQMQRFAAADAAKYGLKATPVKNENVPF